METDSAATFQHHADENHSFQHDHGREDDYYMLTVGGTGGSAAPPMTGHEGEVLLTSSAPEPEAQLPLLAAPSWTLSSQASTTPPPSYFDVTYKSIDMEIMHAHVFGKQFPPSAPIRLQLDHYLPTVGLILLAAFYYFYLVPIYFPATKPQTKDTLERTRQWRSVHNFIMFVYSGLNCGAALYYTVMEGSWTSLETLTCVSSQGTWMRPLSVLFTLSKLWEWWDTAFLIWLGTKPPQFLHVYHHATTFWLFSFVMNLPSEKMGMLLNGFVHTLMYHHYWKPWPKRWVPLITVCQILQLVTGICVWSISPFVCAPPKYNQFGWSNLHLFQFDEMWNRPVEYWTFVTPYAMVPVFLYYFVSYFWKRFLHRPSSLSPASSTTTARREKDKPSQKME